jgi:radical SAM protein with 4Fe4S-binding SPASM domain
LAAAPIPEISLGDFFAGLSPRERRVPLEGVLETSYRCNLNCVHCYVNKPAGDREARQAELPLERLLRLVDEIVEAGCWHVLLTGGEVLIRRDFEPLYRYCISKGLRVTVFTNGTEVTERVADLFDALRPHAVEITLYGASRETYERVTRVPGSFDMCRAGIERLHRRGVPLKLKTMALAWNVHEVAAMRAFADVLGVPFQHDSLLNARVDCGANRNPELQLPAEQVVALDRADPVRFARLAAHAREVVKPRVDHGEGQPVYTCGAGLTGFTVDPYGKLQLCQLSRRHAYDLREGTFEEGWHGFLPGLRARTWQTEAACRRCSLIGLCGSCPGAAELEHGDAEAQVAAFCEITHLRAWSALGEASGHRQDGSCCLGRGRLAAQRGGLIRELKVVPRARRSRAPAPAS